VFLTGLASNPRGAGKLGKKHLFIKKRHLIHLCHPMHLHRALHATHNRSVVMQIACKKSDVMVVCRLLVNKYSENQTKGYVRTQSRWPPLLECQGGCMVRQVLCAIQHLFQPLSLSISKKTYDIASVKTTKNKKDLVEQSRNSNHPTRVISSLFRNCAWTLSYK
jgi:hypothetical protein